MSLRGKWIHKKWKQALGRQTKQRDILVSSRNFLTRPLPPSNTLSLPPPLSPARTAWLILMGRPLFVNVPSCVHRCRLSIIAGLWGSLSIWRHIWHSAASINVVLILIFMSWGFAPFLSSLLFSTPPNPPPFYTCCSRFFDSSNLWQPGSWTVEDPGAFSVPHSTECCSKTVNTTLFPLSCRRRVILPPMCQKLCIFSQAERLQSIIYERIWEGIKTAIIQTDNYVRWYYVCATKHSIYNNNHSLGHIRPASGPISVLN